MRVFLILLGRLMLAGVVMAIAVPALGRAPLWWPLPVAVGCIALVWWYARSTGRRSTMP